MKTNQYDLGLLCAVFGEFRADKYLPRMIRSLSQAMEYSGKRTCSAKLYIAVDGRDNANRVHSILDNESSLLSDWMNLEVVQVRYSELMSIGYMRSSLIKHILGRSDNCNLYFFIDADDYVAPQFFERIMEQCKGADYYPVIGLNTISDSLVSNPSEDHSAEYTSICFGHLPIHGSISDARNLLYQEQLSFALWGYVFTKKCFMYYLDLCGSYEDGVFIERLMDSDLLDYRLIYNIGYVHVLDVPDSLMASKEMPEVSKRSYRAFLAGIADYYLETKYNNTRSLLWSQIEYYADHICKSKDKSDRA